MVKMNEMNVEERMNMLKLSAEYGQGAKTAAGGQANGRDASEKIQLDMAEEIGKEFARAFYNSLATKPAEAFKFYSHESFALLDDGRRYIGQAEIGREIEKRYFEQLTRFQIYSIKSVPSASGGIVVVVCGKRNDSPFVETFVLAQQTAKKFYVFSNIFQLVDEAFDESRRTAAIMQKTEAVQQAAQLPASHNYGQNIMEKITAQNGHGHTPTAPAYDGLNKTPAAGHVDEKPKPDDHHRGSADKPPHHTTTPQKNEPPRKKTSSHSEHHQALKSEHEQSSAPTPPVAATQPQEPPKPRTWANIAEGTNPKQSFNQIAQPQVQHHTTPTNNMSNAAHTQPSDKDGGRGGSSGGRGRGGYRGRGGGFRSGEREGGNYRGGEHRGGDREGGGRGGFRGGPRGGGSSRGDRDNHNRDGGYSGGRGGGARDGNHRGGGGFNRDGGHRGGRGGGAAAAGGNEQR